MITAIDNGIVELVIEHHVSRHSKTGKVCDRATTHQNTAAGFWQTTDACEPLGDGFLDCSWSRCLQPQADDDIKAGREGIAKRADHVARAGYEGKKSRVIDVHAMAQHTLFKFLQNR